MNIKYQKDNLNLVIKESKTWSEVCRKLGIIPRTGSQAHIKKRADHFGIDFSHFLGQRSSLGKISTNRTSAIEYLKTSTSISSNRLREKLIRDKIKEQKCEECGITEWNGQELPFELDHVDGNHFNNELSNLRILCPNCHSIKTRKDRKTSAVSCE